MCVSPLVKVMVCCQRDPTRWLNQFWLTIPSVWSSGLYLGKMSKWPGVCHSHGNPDECCKSKFVGDLGAVYILRHRSIFRQIYRWLMECVIYLTKYIHGLFSAVIAFLNIYDIVSTITYLLGMFRTWNFWGNTGWNSLQLNSLIMVLHSQIRFSAWGASDCNCLSLRGLMLVLTTCPMDCNANFVKYVQNNRFVCLHHFGFYGHPFTKIFRICESPYVCKAIPFANYVITHRPF